MSTCCSVSSESFDLVIVGGGSGAFAAASRAAERGASVAVVERGVIGGTCLNVGCVPSKILIAAARARRHARHHGLPGVPTAAGNVDAGALFAHKVALLDHFREEKYEDLVARTPNLTYIQGEARLLSPFVVAVGDRVLNAEKVILATGGRPSPPPIPGLARVPWIDSTSALSLGAIPEHLVVIGAGYVGLELAQAFHRLGARVTVLEALDRIAAGEEPEVAAALREALVGEGIGVHTGVKVEEVGGAPGAILIRARGAVWTASHLLVATGRRPNTDGLGLAEVGVRTNRRGAILVDDELRTSVEGVWAIGDCNDRVPLVTTAAHEGAVAADNAMANAGRKVADEVVPHAIFTDPEIAAAGLTEAAAREMGLHVRTTRMPMAKVPKAAIVGETAGVVKVVVEEASGRLLGVHVCGAGAADMIQLAALAIRKCMTAAELGGMIFVYPTLTEALKMACQSFEKDVAKMSCCAE